MKAPILHGTRFGGEIKVDAKMYPFDKKCIVWDGVIFHDLCRLIHDLCRLIHDLCRLILHSVLSAVPKYSLHN